MKPTASRQQFVSSLAFAYAVALYGCAEGEALKSANPFEEFFDSHTTGQGIWKFRHYFPAYNKHLSKFVNRDEVHVAEIGVYSGGSLEMWRSVFGPGLHLYGIDLAPVCKVYEEHDPSGRTRIFIGNQSDQSFWSEFKKDVPQLDVLIDDGSHAAEDQMNALLGVLDHLRPGGVYMTEDICMTTHPMLQLSLDYFRSMYDVATQPTYLQQTIDSIHYYPYLLVVEKTEVPRGNLVAPKRGDVWEPTATQKAYASLDEAMVRHGDLDASANPFEHFFDSHTTGRGMQKWRHYFQVYNKYLSKFVNRSEVHVAEIGVSSGGSLEMWRSVFGPGLHLYGIDTAPVCKTYEDLDPSGHTRIFVGDEGNQSFWKAFWDEVPQLDVFIDASGRSSSEQVGTLRAAFSHLRPGGVAITENIHGQNNEFLQQTLEATRDLHEVFFRDTESQQFIDSIHYYPFLFAVEKTDVARAKLDAPKHGTIWLPMRFDVIDEGDSSASSLKRAERGLDDVLADLIQAAAHSEL